LEKKDDRLKKLRQKKSVTVTAIRNAGSSDPRFKEPERDKPSSRDSMSFSPSRLPGGAAVPRFGSSVMNGWSCSHHHNHHRFRRTAGLKSSSHRRPKRASAKTPTVFASSSFQQRDLCEGDEGEDVEILQRDLVEEGLLDQKHANGYVAFLDIFFFSVGLLLRVVVCLLSLSSSNIYTKTLLNFALSNLSLSLHV